MSNEQEKQADLRDARDSVFLHAVIAAGDGETHLFRIRNISSGGLMAEGTPDQVTGEAITIELRNIGTLSGRVAWAVPGRFGVSFDTLIDPKLARKPVGGTR